ncbi:sulfurtransferase [Affinibrenneria salicis]|uniref:Sulfurtransferase n=1 Tax=Affinibrenneria salicis TaxID=2590031 RepID=A0A5J5FU68_9GAMM|nr:rhodanese-like domain-containing protein [Affinibrenneria salicis]KAA8996456.1 sulfurtransferase [Affinibrenneria salicis]
MTLWIDAATLKAWQHDGEPLALLDVREAGQFGAGHLLLAAPVAYSRLELRAWSLLPTVDLRVVLYADGDALAERAVRRLRDIGFTRVAALRGGVDAWQAAGYRLFAGVNVPSKAFGEWVEQQSATPHISAQDLHAWQRQGLPFTLLDGRTLQEHQRMSIPGSVGCPNGELTLRWRSLVDDQTTPVVIHCAGRTRSIIGAQTLRDLGLPNPVYALENGTQGWFLADLPLEHGNNRRFDIDVSASHRQSARQDGARLAQRFAIPVLSAAQAQNWLRDPTPPVYLFDIRTAEEFAAGSVAGAVHAPGGQLLQETDRWVAARPARIILLDNADGRAAVIASWLQRMGFQAATLAQPVEELRVLSGWPRKETFALAPLPVVTPEQLNAQRHDPALRIVDIRPSADFNVATLPGARWSSRPLAQRLLDDLPSAVNRLVLLASHPDDAALWRAELSPRAPTLSVLSGGIDAWQAAGLPVLAPATPVPDAQRIDFLFFTHDRHQGNKEAARQYLAWEQALLEQLDEKELAAITGQPLPRSGRVVGQSNRPAETAKPQAR